MRPDDPKIHLPKMSAVSSIKYVHFNHNAISISFQLISFPKNICLMRIKLPQLLLLAWNRNQSQNEQRITIIMAIVDYVLVLYIHTIHTRFVWYSGKWYTVYINVNLEIYTDGGAYYIWALYIHFIMPSAAPHTHPSGGTSIKKWLSCS